MLAHRHACALRLRQRSLPRRRSGKTTPNRTPNTERGFMNVIGGSGLAAGILLLCAYGVGQQMQGQTAPAAHADSSVIASDGTAYVTRIVPVPATVSPQAQKLIGRQMADAAAPQTLAERRSRTATWQ